nr:hypothetical protein Iba_chr14cCG10810 [Ipomoea batatas]
MGSTLEGVSGQWSPVVRYWHGWNSVRAEHPMISIIPTNPSPHSRDNSQLEAQIVSRPINWAEPNYIPAI